VQVGQELKVATLMRRYGEGRISSHAFFVRLRQLSASSESEEALRQRFVKERILGLQCGASELLVHLTKRKHSVALLSNTNDAHWSHIRTLDSFDGVNHFFLSFQIGCQKPGPEIYRHVEQSTAISGTQIIFFDDDEANVRAALARGWDAHCVTPKVAIEEIRGHLHAAGLT
jgi:putative hydrolase of the HAD superfamily